MEQVLDMDPDTAQFLSVMAPGYYNSMSHRGLESASRPETFNDPDDPFNAEPPPYWVSFIIGGVLWVISFGMFLHRVSKLKERTEGKMRGYDLYRGWIACAIDNDSPYYTITSFSAISFLFLGGVQLDYENTLLAMIIYYFFVSFGDSLRVLMAYWTYESLHQVQILSEQATGLMSKREEAEREKDGKFETMELQPSNIYEDMGREKTIVVMIFLTQIILVSFVCIDIYQNKAINCLDGTRGCPVAGTWGSYGFYMMGIFQACVYLLGPKTSFGQSEQNPEFWLVLLLASKKNKARLLWENPVKDPSNDKKAGKLRDPDGNYICGSDGEPRLYHQQLLHETDWRMWRRFFMSYLVNGVCFHILVHALPIQVASQSSFTGVVFRAVGMMYLIDLDDSKGFRLVIAPRDEDEEPKKEGDDGTDEQAPIDEAKEDMELQRPPGQHTPMIIDASGSVTPMLESKADQDAMAAEANEILEEAQHKLEILRQNGPSSRTSLVGGRVSRISLGAHHPSMKASVKSSSLGIITFGNKGKGGSTARDLGSDKKNTGQAALLQASASGDAGGGGAAAGGDDAGDVGGDDAGGDGGGGGDA